MKYIILIGDGMADNPIAELDGKTPLQVAKTPNMDRIANSGKVGLLESVPEGYPPGSDVANLSILGYDPKDYYTGRAPLEAANIGIELKEGEVAFRCNLVALKDSGDETIMADYSAGHISTEEADEIIKTLDAELKDDGFRFHTGKSYRHLMVTSFGAKVEATPPHDISDNSIAGHEPKGEDGEKINALMERSRAILKDHPVNIKRREAGKNEATSIWLWGQGKAPKMESYEERFGRSGSIISAVDLMNGIGVYAGLTVIDVPGVTGYIDTNYTGKAEYGLNSLKDKDFICIHVEAPDEAGHQGLLKEKIQAIEDFDELVVGYVLENAHKFGEFRIMVVSDHPTPVELKTHTSDPVPFAMIDSGESNDTGLSYNEVDAKKSGIVLDNISKYIEEFLS